LEGILKDAVHLEEMFMRIVLALLALTNDSDENAD
jgi:hypothetical protein